jgi:polyisoprenoid-binding protein YceI
MKKILLLAGFAVALVSSMAIGETSAWQVDAEHSDAHFTVRHLGISTVQGDFTKMTGAVQFDDQDISKSTVNATIDVASVDTRVESRDKAIRSPEYFDVATYPTMTFQSTKIWKTGDTTKMSGNLTIHGVTKEVTFDVIGPTAPVKVNGTNRRGATATTKVNRKDFGVKGGAPGVVGDDINIELDLELVGAK